VRIAGELEHHDQRSLDATNPAQCVSFSVGILRVAS
jgi:hypothetical protein